MLTLGQYTAKRQNFSKYIAPYFPMYPVHATSSCGEDAIFTLTGERYTDKEHKKYGKFLSRDQMVKFLRKKNFTVIPLTVCKVSQQNFFYNAITDKHVVLNNQLMYRSQSSWSICYRNKYCHNCSWEDPHILEFVNRPIIASYIVWHASWSDVTTASVWHEDTWRARV